MAVSDHEPDQIMSRAGFGPRATISPIPVLGNDCCKNLKKKYIYINKENIDTCIGT